MCMQRRRNKIGSCYLLDMSCQLCHATLCYAMLCYGYSSSSCRGQPAGCQSGARRSSARISLYRIPHGLLGSPQFQISHLITSNSQHYTRPTHRNTTHFLAPVQARRITHGARRPSTPFVTCRQNALIDPGSLCERRDATCQILRRPSWMTRHPGKICSLLTETTFQTVAT